MRQADGVFDEYGYLPSNNNITAFLGLRKPITAWTPGEDYLRQDPDGFFQRYLYLGIFPMAPFPENATPVAWLHAIQPGEWAEQQYRDYGPLLDMNQGKKWVLEAHAVAVEGDQAKANLFETPQGHVIPVVFGGTNPKVTVLLRKFRGLPGNVRCEALHPGSPKPVPVTTARHWRHHPARSSLGARLRGGAGASRGTLSTAARFGCGHPESPAPLSHRMKADSHEVTKQAGYGRGRSSGFKFNKAHAKFLVLLEYLDSLPKLIPDPRTTCLGLVSVRSSNFSLLPSPGRPSLRTISRWCPRLAFRQCLLANGLQSS